MSFVVIDGYPIDAVETEEHTLTSEITEHPVEDGADISDNIRNKPRELTLTSAIVSNTPIGAIKTDPSRTLAATGGTPPPAIDAYRRLEQIWLARSTVTVVTALRKYENMALETLTIPQEAKGYGALIFTAHFKEVRIVKNKRVTVAVPNLGGEGNYGLSLDKLIAGSRVLWRKGNPPGTSPQTVPAGVITGQEVVTVQSRKDKPSLLLHANGKELSTAELNAFALDLDRDQRLMTNRALARASNDVSRIGSVQDRAEAMNNYKQVHPGETVEPSMFGLTRDPTTNRWTTK